MNTKKTVALTLLAVMLFGGCGEKTKNDPEKLLKTGKYEEASETYIALIDKDSENADLYTGLADAYVGMKEYEAAVDTLCEGYELTGNKVLVKKMSEITGGLFKVSSDKISYQTVIYCCERVLECGEDADMYEMIAMSYMKMEQFDKAFETAVSGAEKTSDDSLTGKIASELYSAGSKADKNGKKEIATQCLGYVLQLEPDNKEAADLLDTVNGVKKEDEPKEDDEKTEKPQAPEKPAPSEEQKPASPVTPEPVEPQPQQPASEPQPTRTYTVQIGAYGELANAENKVAAANAAGLSASYFSSGGLYRVTIGTYSSESEANAAVSRANAAGFSAVII